MFDQAANKDAVILEPSISALYSKIKSKHAFSSLLHSSIPPNLNVSYVSGGLDNKLSLWILPHGLLPIWVNNRHVTLYTCAGKFRSLRSWLLVAGTLAKREMRTVQLSDQVTSGKEQWLRWHANFSASRAELLQKVGLQDLPNHI